MTTEVRPLAKLVSILFHPILTSPIAFLLLILTGNPDAGENKIILSVVAVFFSSMVTMIYVLYLKKTGVVESLDVDVRERRINPLIVGICAYVIGFILLTALDASAVVRGLMFCYITNTMLVLLITYRWKVSIHATGTAGPMVALNYHFGASVIPLYGLVVAVAVSRVILKKHTVGQVIVGAVIGLGLTALQLELLFL